MSRLPAGGRVLRRGAIPLPQRGLQGEPGGNEKSPPDARTRRAISICAKIRFGSGGNIQRGTLARYSRVIRKGGGGQKKRDGRVHPFVPADTGCPTSYCPVGGSCHLSCMHRPHSLLPPELPPYLSHRLWSKELEEKNWGGVFFLRFSKYLGVSFSFFTIIELCF